MGSEAPTGREGGRPRSRSLGVVALMLMASTVAACGSSGGSANNDPPAPSALVVAPDYTLQGCTFLVNGSVPPGEPQGVNPNFPSFPSTVSSNKAITTIAQRGGTAIVDGTGLPSGTKLYGGPDATGPVVGVIPANDSIVVAEPVLWTDAKGGKWLAFFLICGGRNLYWASLDEVQQLSPAAGETITSLIDQLSKAPPYSTSHQASLLGIKVEKRALVWDDSSVQFTVGRGEMIPNGP